ncbi:related to cytochrome P450 oxidoreductase [Phialocephala subalpina]|uniref:Related to cytochrome P450 oxidoreductase n=1 Tax=Phialocephala subalpina TaxID=576137 RepID=A0A1L7X0J1_9HELO|nr:related to cytochrome P450 oxidoreductase [Phialocephala subalpina]
MAFTMDSGSALLSPMSAGLFLVSIVAYTGYVCYHAFLGVLADLPGPFTARFTNFWRVKSAASGKAPAKFQNLHRKYGSVVRVGPSHVSVSDPAQIPVIYGISSKFTKSPFYNVFGGCHSTLSIDASVLITSDPVIDNKVYRSIFTLQSQSAHRILKASIAQKYSLSSLLTLEPLVDTVTRNFMSTLRERSQTAPDTNIAGTRLDLGEWLQFYAFDVIGAITFSRTFGFIDDGKDERGVLRGLEGGLTYGAVVGQVPGAHPWLMGNPVLQNTVLKIPAIAKNNPVPIVYQMIKDQLASRTSSEQTSTREDFITFMKKQHEKDPERMSEATMMNHMFVNLLAGSDTTAISLRTIFYLLMKNPHVYAKLQAEIDDADAAGLLSPILTYAEAQTHVPYLALVIKEALRIHPAVALPLERIVPHGGIQINSHHIPAGTTIGINAWVVHYDTAVFGEDAYSFRPERWEDDGSERLKVMERSFFAFGHGSRSCIGKNISLMEMGKFVPQFLREFEITWDGDEEWKVESNWFAKQTNVFVRYKSRERKASTS